MTGSRFGVEEVAGICIECPFWVKVDLQIAFTGALTGVAEKVVEVGAVVQSY